LFSYPSQNRKSQVLGILCFASDVPEVPHVPEVPQDVPHVPLIPTFLFRMVSQHQEEFVDENLLVSHRAKQLFTEVQGKVP
jgi:hypothetical protein